MRERDGERVGDVIGVAKRLGDVPALLALEGEGVRERAGDEGERLADETADAVRGLLAREREGERLTDETVDAVLGVARRSARRPRLLPRRP